jgi:hypothetical protein
MIYFAIYRQHTTRTPPRLPRDTPSATDLFILR